RRGERKSAPRRGGKKATPRESERQRLRNFALVVTLPCRDGPRRQWGPRRPEGGDRSGVQPGGTRTCLPSRASSAGSGNRILAQDDTQERVAQGTASCLPQDKVRCL